MSRNDLLYLKDILKAVGRIETYISNVDVENFKTDNMRVDSVLFNLMTIGEAVKNIPDSLRNQYPEVRWNDIGRFRDRVVHHYFGLDLDIVWEIVDVHLPILKTHVEQLLEMVQQQDSDDN